MVFSYSLYPISIHKVFTIKDFLREFKIRIVAPDSETQEIAKWILDNSSEIIININTPNELFDRGIVRNQVDVIKLLRRAIFSIDSNEIKKIRKALSDFFFEKIKEYNLNKFKIEVINPFILKNVKEKIEQYGLNNCKITHECITTHTIETHIYREDSSLPFGYDIDSYIIFRMYFDQENERDLDYVFKLLEEFYDYAKILLLMYT